MSPERIGQQARKKINTLLFTYTCSIDSSNSLRIGSEKRLISAQRFSWLDQTAQEKCQKGRTVLFSPIAMRRNSKREESHKRWFLTWQEEIKLPAAISP